MNLRQAILMIAAMVVAASVEMARENNMFAGHPNWVYIGFALAAILVIIASIVPNKTKEPSMPTLNTGIKGSFNPANTLTANPTINVQLTEPRLLAPIKYETPPPLEPNLVLCRAWKEALYRVGDAFHFRVGQGQEASFSRWVAIVAEIRNVTSESPIGAAKSVIAELVF